MKRLIVYLAFIICCGPSQGGEKKEADAVEVIATVNTFNLWDDDQLIMTTHEEKSTLENCGAMWNGELPALNKNMMPFVRNTLDLIK
uniref:Uncharacterized protein n=1 Tax=Onchocerca volvulus TaxID=6282 RepID=A0A8R1TRM9_ONCVO